MTSKVPAAARVEAACADLARSGQRVTFTAIAAATGLSRTTLYRDQALRAIIDGHRQHGIAATSLTGLADELSTLRAAIEAIASNVRRHEEQLRALRRAKR